MANMDGIKTSKVKSYFHGLNVIPGTGGLFQEICNDLLCFIQRILKNIIDDNGIETAGIFHFLYGLLRRSLIFSSGSVERSLSLCSRITMEGG